MPHIKTKAVAGIAIAALAANLMVAGCSSGTEGSSGGSSPSASLSGIVSSADTVAAFNFHEDSVNATGDGTAFESDGTAVKVTAPGTYMVTGTCPDGSISVKKDLEGEVTLILSDLTLSSSKGAPVSIGKSSSAVLEIQGKVSLADAEDPQDENSSDPEVKDAYDGAAIRVKSEADLVVTGDGELSLDGSAAEHGIKGESDSTIVIGKNASDTVKVGISAAKKGINGEGVVTVLGGELSVESEGDGIHSDKKLTIGDVDENGTSPVLSVDAAKEGIEGASVIINSGKLSVHAKDDGINAANPELDDWTYELTINGGDVEIDAGGDGLDSNGDLNINGGNVVVSGSEDGGNCAIDAGDGAMWNQKGGTVFGIGNSSMAEDPSNGVFVKFGAESGFGGFVQPPDGFGDRKRSDASDGSGNENANSNASGEEDSKGSKGSSNGNRPELPDGMNMPKPSGDGERPEFSGNANMPKPSDGGDMPKPSDGDSFPGFPGGDLEGALELKAGDKLEVKDSSGNVVGEASVAKGANHVIFSCEGMAAGDTYTLHVNGEEVAEATAQEGTGQANAGFAGMFGGKPGQDDRSGAAAANENSEKDKQSGTAANDNGEKDKQSGAAASNGNGEKAGQSKAAASNGDGEKE